MRTGQEHLCAALERLPREDADHLASQLREVDLDLIARLVDRLVRTAGPRTLGEVTPADAADFIRLPETADDEQREQDARHAGRRMLSEGRVAAVLLAGGQGSRLGFPGPKGDFPFLPITRRTLFWQHCTTIAALRTRYGAPLPLYILTSPTNDAETRAIFAANAHYGLPPESVRFVVQGTLPAVDACSGALLREEPDRLALSPDGHGGLLNALRRAGALDEMVDADIETLFTYQVDNPLVRCCRPEFLGHHALAEADMSSVVVRKLSPEERMGVIAHVDGLPGVVEYSDLPDELAGARTADGELVFWAGSIAVHCIQLRFAQRLTDGSLTLMHHRALKRVEHVDDADRPVVPDEPNAVKFETFLFDALAHARRTIAVEARREEEFAPIKNADGADSPESARRAVNRRNAAWIEAGGGRVRRDESGEPVDVEIDPRYALDAEELQRRLPRGVTIDEPTVIDADFAPAV
ncbi:MAG TPA: UTP--glucose-1-phosphate uridylyltransferase [Miltoncostaeaceae bacterium]|nr:UTP--glucose-1-phosphate uridylyltransferase [Miltoncostaeaceae bacterium]